jgi:hypothetical protein
VTSPGLSLDTGELLPDEERRSTVELRDAASYRELLARLSRQSVAKHYDAYEDVPWDDPGYAIDAGDPRWELLPSEPLGATDWYRALPQAERARLGLEFFASFMKIGRQFENALQRGLLEYAFELPPDAPEFRYVMHEVIEESHHSLMFHEFVRRTGLPVSGLPPWMKRGSRWIVRLSRRFPELFFMFVLGGEDPIDFVQRDALRSGQFRHPLLARISQIHVTEEARHISFARAYLRRHVPRLGAPARVMLAVRAPLLLGQMSRIMMEPTRTIVERYRIPKDVLRAAYTSEPARRRRAEALAKPRELASELGLLAPPFDRLWRRQGI